MKIVIIGAGNLSYHLSVRLHQHKEIELLVVNHKKNTVLKKLSSLNIATQSCFNSIPNDADAYIIAIKDHYIKNITQLLHSKISTKKSTFIHTSGATDSTVLSMFKNYGVIYPLYSFLHTEENITWDNIPIYTIANNTTAKNTIHKISNYLNPHSVLKVNDKTKLQIHLLAVFGNNFINALLQATYEISKKNIHLYQNNFNLILQTIQKARNKNQKNIQTGPAVRFDKSSIEKHLLYLSRYPEIKKLYQCLSSYIQKNIAHEKHKK